MTEPHPFVSTDPAVRRRAIQADIAKKISLRPRVDAQGKRLDPPVPMKYDEFGMLLGPVDEPAVEGADE
jgi:hypothetical protein